MWPNIINIMGGSAQDQNRDSAICDVLLVSEVLVYRDQNVKLTLCERKQCTIFFAAETCLPHSIVLVAAAKEKELDLPRQALVLLQLHFHAAARLILASSRAAMAPLAGHARKVCAKFSQAALVLEVVGETLERHPRSRKTGSPLRIPGLRTMTLEDIALTFPPNV
jgi:hypothetical protein